MSKNRLLKNINTPKYTIIPGGTILYRTTFTMQPPSDWLIPVHDLEERLFVAVHNKLMFSSKNNLFQAFGCQKDPFLGILNKNIEQRKSIVISLKVPFFMIFDPHIDRDENVPVIRVNWEIIKFMAFQVINSTQSGS